MNDREKKLAILVAALVVGWIGWSLWGGYQSALDSRRTERDNAAKAVRKAKIELAKADEAILRLEAYQDRSLPADPQDAQREYRAWLIDQLDSAGLRFDGVTLKDNRPNGDSYTALVYTSTAEGSLTSVTRFLHAFYDSPLLHKITMLRLTPLPRGKLRLSFDVQALCVTGATREEGMPEPGSGRLELGDVKAYLASIVERDIFSEYVPPRPPPPPREPRQRVTRDTRPPPPPKPKFDDAAHAYLTGVVQSGERLQAWIFVRTKNETIRVYEGDDLRVGLLAGEVISISPKRIVIDTKDGLFATSLGSHLRDGEKLTAEDVF